MMPIDRRDFLSRALATGATLAASTLPRSDARSTSHTPPASRHAEQKPSTPPVIDFRFAPIQRQTAFCFPDDPYKSLVDESGQLLYGYDRYTNVDFFPLKIGFGLHGMKAPKVLSQLLESPSIPIVRTTLEYPGVTVTLTTFATNAPDEGRIDNVLFEATPLAGAAADIEPVLDFDTLQKFDLEEKDGVLTVLHRDSRRVLLIARVLGSRPLSTDRAASFESGTDRALHLVLHHGQASKGAPYRAFFRFPQTSPPTTPIADGLAAPAKHLESCRAFWTSFSIFHAPVAIAIPGREGEFALACARNILQAREIRDGKLTFQVGPTCYRGLWVVDGNFLLEAARYLGLDHEAVEGLRTTWSLQLATGQVVGAGGREHWKDTGIAIFTLVRQCELSQDWSLLHELTPQLVHAVQFLRSLQAEAVRQGSALGGYGLLAKGFADGGIGGVRDEFTNTLWVLAGLQALAEVAENEKIDSLKDARQFHNELRAAFFKAASREMRRHEAGFDFLPMVLRNDPEWQLPDLWDRPRPQSAQWALSHAIFPGRVFSSSHPIVRGHVQLMQAVTQEGIPAETGWLHHQSVWNYNAAFVAEVYLWLGMKQAAHDTFVGFLNHASPQYCWREEQPLQSAHVGSYVGDMPHNWASAECIRYVRHTFALEDGDHLRLLAGITAAELELQSPHILAATPTRFGRLNLKLEPLDRGQGWRLVYERSSGP